MYKCNPENPCLASLHRDFRLLKDLKQVLIDELRCLATRLSNEPESCEELANLCKNASFKPLPCGDGRTFRRVYPLGVEKILSYMPSDATSCAAIQNEAKSSPGLWFVGFFGTQLPTESITSKAMESLWAIDDRLLKELPSHGIVAYASSEVVAGGDWFNLVLVEGSDVLEQWRDARGHDIAVR